MANTHVFDDPDTAASKGETNVGFVYTVDPATGKATVPGTVANQRVNAQSGDFVANSITDLATLLALAGTPTDANTVNSLMGRLTKLRDLLNSVTYDNTNEVRVSLYGKGAAAGDTAVSLDTVTGGLTISQFIQQQILQGHGFRATTGLVATGAGNAYVGMQAIINNIAKNILIYNLLAFSGSGAQSLDGRLYQNNASTADAALTSNLLTSIKNQQPASANTSLLSALWGSPASTTQTGSFVGTQVGQAGITASNTFNLLQNGSLGWFKAGDVGSLATYIKVTTSANAAGVTIEYIEF